nr:MAG TPA: hypothetical protein [Caudoviricetes sp.]
MGVRSFRSGFSVSHLAGQGHFLLFPGKLQACQGKHRGGHQLLRGEGAVLQPAGADHHLEGLHAHPGVVLVHHDFPHREILGLVDMPGDNAVNAVNGHAVALHPHGGVGGVNAAARPMGHAEGIAGVGRPGPGAVPELQLQIGGVLAVHVLQIQFAGNVIGRAFVGVLGGAPLVIAPHHAQDPVPQGGQLLDHQPLLLPGAHGLLKGIAHAGADAIVNQVPRQNHVGLRILQHLFAEGFPFRLHVLHGPQMHVGDGVNTNIGPIGKAPGNHLKIMQHGCALLPAVPGLRFLCLLLGQVHLADNGPEIPLAPGIVFRQVGMVFAGEGVQRQQHVAGHLQRVVLIGLSEPAGHHFLVAPAELGVKVFQILAHGNQSIVNGGVQAFPLGIIHAVHFAFFIRQPGDHQQFPVGQQPLHRGAAESAEKVGAGYGNIGPLAVNAAIRAKVHLVFIVHLRLEAKHHPLFRGGHGHYGGGGKLRLEILQRLGDHLLHLRLGKCLPGLLRFRLGRAGNLPGGGDLILFRHMLSPLRIKRGNSLPVLQVAAGEGKRPLLRINLRKCRRSWPPWSRTRPSRPCWP